MMQSEGLNIITHSFEDFGPIGIEHIFILLVDEIEVEGLVGELAEFLAKILVLAFRIFSLALLDILVVDVAQKCLLVESIELEIFSAVLQIHFHDIAQVEVAILGFLLATECDNAESPGLHGHLPCLSFKDVDVLAVSQPPFVLFVLFLVELHVLGRRKSRVIFGLDGAIQFVQVDAHWLGFVGIEFLYVID